MNTSQTVMLALAVVGLTVLMLSTRRKVRERGRQPRPTVRQRYAELERETGAKRGLEEVMLELDQLSRQIHGRLDTKFVKLEAVIRDADQRIDQLSRLVRAASRGPGCDVTLDPVDPGDGSPDSDPEPRDSPHSAVYCLADAGLSVRDIAEELSQPDGEVELILALRKAKRKAGRVPNVLDGTKPGLQS